MKTFPESWQNVTALLTKRDWKLMFSSWESKSTVVFFWPQTEIFLFWKRLSVFYFKLCWVISPPLSKSHCILMELNIQNREDLCIGRIIRQRDIKGSFFSPGRFLWIALVEVLWILYCLSEPDGVGVSPWRFITLQQLFLWNWWKLPQNKWRASTVTVLGLFWAFFLLFMLVIQGFNLSLEGCTYISIYICLLDIRISHSNSLLCLLQEKYLNTHA